MDETRLVAVTGPGGPGSGYVVGPRLVLTSAHVVAREGGRVRVFRPGGDREFVGEPVWCGTPGGRDDAALVLITDDGWRPPPGAGVRWGRPVTSRPGLDCETWGVPDLAQRNGTAIEASQQRGHLNPGSGFVNNQYVMDLSAYPPSWPDGVSSPWGGLSGAAMFCDRLLTGVVLAESAHSGHSALKVVPAYVLHHDASFRAVLADHAAGPQQLEAVEFQDLAAVETAPAKALGSPAALLTADRQTVPFRGRTELVNRLEAWCGLGGFGAWLLHGPGGQGKTRLARHFAGTLAADGWAVLWPHAGATAAEVRALRRVAKPLLVVVDYAESRTAQLAGLVEAAAEHGGGTPFKILLLARTAGDWWTRAQALSGVVEDYLEGTPVLALPPLDPDPPDRAEAYQDAVRAFAAALPYVEGYGQHDWPVLADAFPVPRLTREGLGNALTLQMTALADLLDQADAPGAAGPDTDGVPATATTPTAAPRPSVEKRLLGHERRYWDRMARAGGLTPGLTEDTLDDAVTAALLAGAADRDQADRTLCRLIGLADQHRDRRDAVAFWLAALFPSPVPGRLWGSLYPDRLAERFVGLRLEADPRLADRLADGLADSPAQAADAPQAAQLLTVYSRAAAHPDVRGRLDEHLTALCVRHGARLAPQLIDVATQTEHPGPLLAALERITDGDIALDDLRRLVALLPLFSRRLAGWAATATARLADRCRSLPPDSPGRLPLLANVLIELSNRQSDMGRQEEALATIEEAVAAFRLLARADPAPHLHTLAKALNNLSNRLGDLGRREEALTVIESAVRIRYRLAEESEEAFAEHFPDYAMALNNMSTRLSDLGRHQEALETAEEALVAHRLLAELDPDAHLPDLARITSNHAVRLAALGRRDEARSALESALTTCQDLAERRPDAHLPDLAMVLGNLAVELGALGRAEEALAMSERAVAAYRTLADGHPGAHLPDLAWVMSNLSARLNAVGRTEDSLAAAEQAVTMYEGLAEVNPDAHLADLATALDRKFLRLFALNRVDEALAAVVRAVSIYRGLAGHHPDLHLPALARNLHSLAAALTALGRSEEALAALDESIALRRDLAAADPGTHQDFLAMSEQLRIRITALRPPPEKARVEAVVRGVLAVVAEQLGLDEDEIGPDDTLVEDLGADELDLVELIMAVEDTFGIEIPDDHAESVVTARELVNAVLAQLP
ncbi:acyl carrier protein [Kitasatospora sp. NPDC059408]|uniref:acyl carrier protein n=1 Tax=Kitasatospora sp. NPDC059408 TaxID=3346823 RepID=UPI00369AC5C9